MKAIALLGNNDMGLYKFRKELIERLLEEKYAVMISTPYGEYIPLLEKMGCKYIPLEYDRAGRKPLKELKLIVEYDKMMRKNPCSVALLYTIKPTLYAGLVCRIRKIPYIVNITGLSPVLLNPGILQKICFFIYRRVLPFSRMVFFQNKKNLRLFQQHKAVGKTVHLIPGSGVNLSEHCYEPYQEEEALRILFVGRIVKVKGIDELLNAIEKLRCEDCRLEFEFIGPCDSNYKGKIEELSREGKITYHGACDNPHDYMKEAQAVIMPSYAEGMSNVLLEASACGRPVLASDVQGCREIVQDGVTGFLFPARSVDGIVRAIKKLCALTREQREQMGIAGRKYVEEHFSREIVVNEYMDQINLICNAACGENSR